MSKPTLGWSDFANGWSRKGTGHSYSSLSDADVVRLTLHNWEHREPGDGETTIDRKIVVPIRNLDINFPDDGEPWFYGASALLHEDMLLSSEVTRRQEGEDLHIKTHADTEIGTAVPEACNFVKIVCYSAAALLENGGKRTTDAAWEIVCILASPVEEVPMHPLTMARNMLELPGGTKSEYTAEEFAKAIYYWSQRVSVG